MNSAHSPDSNGKQFLVIAPEQAAADRLAAHLISAGHSRVKATTFHDFSHRLEDLSPDLVVTDVATEPRLALNALDCIRDRRPARQLPVIVCGATTSANNRAAVLNAGAADYLIHPVEGPELLARVQLTLQNQALIDSLEARAHIDALTGLANRHALASRLESEWSRCLRARQHLAVFMIDLDHFKAINDQLGHINGDRILRHVARILHLSVRPHDLAARFGGEEFAILAADCPIHAAMRIAERFRKRLARHPILIHDQPRWITVSIGVAAAVPNQPEIPLDPASILHSRDLAAAGTLLRPTLRSMPPHDCPPAPNGPLPVPVPDHAHAHAHLVTPEILFAQADHALYQAKTHGRNATWVWHADRRLALPASRFNHPSLAIRRRFRAAASRNTPEPPPSAATIKPIRL